MVYLNGNFQQQINGTIQSNSICKHTTPTQGVFSLIPCRSGQTNYYFPHRSSKPKTIFPMKLNSYYFIMEVNIVLFSYQSQEYIISSSMPYSYDFLIELKLVLYSHRRKVGTLT